MRHVVTLCVRSVIVGLSLTTTKAHIARALLEGVCLQTREVRCVPCAHGALSVYGVCRYVLSDVLRVCVVGIGCHACGQ